MELTETPRPFERYIWHKLRDFRDFEEQLKKAGRGDKSIGDRLRIRAFPWVKVRNDEVYPAWYYSRHLQISNSAEYRLTNVGADVDIELRIPDAGTRRLQITTAGPIWPNGPSEWGADHIIHMEQLNQYGESFGWGPYRRRPDGSVNNRDEMIASDERDPAYLKGLVQALKGKRFHQQHDCELVVYASAYDQALLSSEIFLNMAKAAMRAVPLDNFLSINLLSATKGYFLQSTSSS